MARLEILQQPVAEFYKDEGGKSNWISTTVRLVGMKPCKNPKPCPVRAILLYEGGQQVEAHDQQILRLEVERKTGILLDWADSTAPLLINFRIEKVSRRKDNQKFQLRVEIDSTHSDYEEFKHITAATTRPICVLSKRKIPAHLRTDPSALAALKSGRKRPRSSSLSSTSSSNHYHQSDQKSDPRIYSKLDQLVGVVESLQTIILQQENAISELVGSVQELKTEVEALGGKPKSSIDLSILTTAGRRQKRNLSAMSDGSILRPETPNFGIPVNSADITGMSPSGGPTASPLWGNDDRSPRARGAPGGVKRLKSEDMLFNFGVPGGTNSPFAVERLGSPGTFLKNE